MGDRNELPDKPACPPRKKMFRFYLSAFSYGCNHLVYSLFGLKAMAEISTFAFSRRLIVINENIYGFEMYLCMQTIVLYGDPIIYFGSLRAERAEGCFWPLLSALFAVCQFINCRLKG